MTFAGLLKNYTSVVPRYGPALYRRFLDDVENPQNKEKHRGGHRGDGAESKRPESVLRGVCKGSRRKGGRWHDPHRTSNRGRITQTRVALSFTVVTGPARPKNARSLSATNRDEPHTPKYISETLNSFSTSLVPCKTTSRKRARARAAENPKKIK